MAIKTSIFLIGLALKSHNSEKSFYILRASQLPADGLLDFAFKLQICEHETTISLLGLHRCLENDSLQIFFC